MNEIKQLKRNWLIFAITGLSLIGLGLSVMGEALIRKYEAEIWQDWFWWGTAALITINTGISLFGKAVTLRVRLDQNNESRNS
ncbi:MAG: hypothetical protein ACJAXX_002031 [Roseivirga sp.]|jgi:hypothetical protein